MLVVKLAAAAVEAAAAAAEVAVLVKTFFHQT